MSHSFEVGHTAYQIPLTNIRGSTIVSSALTFIESYTLRFGVNGDLIIATSELIDVSGFYSLTTCFTTALTTDCQRAHSYNRSNIRTFLHVHHT